ncbi:hypothetical protein QTP70_016921, partial [Hemibagrus guttatus]
CNPEPILPSAMIITLIRWDIIEEIQQAQANNPPPSVCPPTKLFVPNPLCPRVLRGLNAVTVCYPYLLPLVPAVLEQLEEAQIFTKLDLPSTYNLAFTNKILKFLIERYIIAYIDDILIYSTSYDNHICHVLKISLKNHALHKSNSNQDSADLAAASPAFCESRKLRIPQRLHNIPGLCNFAEGVEMDSSKVRAVMVGCMLEEKESFWSELDEVMESIPMDERVVIGADFNGHVGEGNTGDEEVMGKFGIKERNLEGQIVVDFAKRMGMAVLNTYFQKREGHRVTYKSVGGSTQFSIESTYKSGGRRTQVDYILCRRGNLKEISDCKVVVGVSVARQHRMVVCRMTLMVCKTKRSKIEIEKKTKWWKLKREECCEEFRQKLRQALGGQIVLPDDWETTEEVIRETGRKVLGVSSGRRKEDKETWWWNEEVQDSIQRKRLAKKKWDMDRTEENRQEYKELQRRVKREVSKAKQKAYDELYTRLDTREGEKDLYRLARQRDRDGKDVQQVRVIKDRDGRVLTSEESVQRRWKEYFEELMNEENEREKRVEGVNSVEQKVDKVRKDEVRKALKRMKSGKAVGPDDIPVEVWKCLGEAAVEFLTSFSQKGFRE